MNPNFVSSALADSPSKSSPTAANSDEHHQPLARFLRLKISDDDLPTLPGHVIQSRVKQLYKLHEDISITIEGGGIFEEAIDIETKKYLDDLLGKIEREVAGYEGYLQLLEKGGIDLTLHELLNEKEELVSDSSRLASSIISDTTSAKKQRSDKDPTVDLESQHDAYDDDEYDHEHDEDEEESQDQDQDQESSSCFGRE